MHPLLKKGVVEVGVTDPENPGSHGQPLMTDAPLLLLGQATAVQVPVKDGAPEAARIVPENPATQLH